MNAPILTASHQWATRPTDERFTSLYEMRAKMDFERDKSREVVVSNRRFSLAPGIANADGTLAAPMASDHRALAVVSDKGHAYAPTHWAFGQLAALAGAPAGYLRTLPADIACDAINYGLKFARDVEDVGLLLYRNGDSTLRAATGPRYGRIWNSDILATLTDRYGDGTTGEWRVPGEFGQRVEVTKDNTTLYAGDRDMFIFLANEDHRIEIPNRRDGKPGTLARGFFVWNSEVGSKSFGIATFLYDYVCCNRMIWGAEGFKEVTMRHSAGAPDRWLEEMQPALRDYANASTESITDLIANARNKRLSGDELDSFLANRFGKGKVAAIKAVHELEENGRPIETLWDVTTAVSAMAKGVHWQDDRVAMERDAGKVLVLAR